MFEGIPTRLIAAVAPNKSNRDHPVPRPDIVAGLMEKHFSITSFAPACVTLLRRNEPVPTTHVTLYLSRRPFRRNHENIRVQ